MDRALGRSQLESWNLNSGKGLARNPHEKFPRFHEKNRLGGFESLLRSWSGRPFKIITSGLVITPEASTIHSPAGFWTLHECLPDESGSRVLRHEHSNSSINSNHAAVIPIGEGIESVYKSVLGPGSPITILDRSQDEHYRLG